MKNYIIADNNIYPFQGNGNKEDGFEVPCSASTAQHYRINTQVQCKGD